VQLGEEGVTTLNDPLSKIAKKQKHFAKIILKKTYKVSLSKQRFL
jgi:hypothetical protein